MQKKWLHIRCGESTRPESSQLCRDDDFKPYSCGKRVDPMRITHASATVCLLSAERRDHAEGAAFQIDHARKRQRILGRTGIVQRPPLAPFRTLQADEAMPGVEGRVDIVKTALKERADYDTR